jgi:NADP-dependent 3-hydroxy acid dehydrogenase YdfG
VSDNAALAGRTALVTGASRGIGRSIVEALAGAGARVWCLARTEADIRALAAEVGGEALTCDLADDAATWEALDGMTDTIGGAPDIVVNSAGVFGIASLSTETVAAFDRAVAINLRGTFLVNRIVLPSMLQRASGLIVNVGSVAGRRAFRGNGAYSASKYGLRGYHEVLVEELRGTGVRATLIEPASTDTPIWDPFDPDNNPKLPNRKDMLRVRDVAEAVLFLSTRPADVSIPLLQIERA